MNKTFVHQDLNAVIRQHSEWLANQLHSQRESLFPPDASKEMGAVRPIRTRLCKDSKADPYAAPSWRHSARATARLSLKFVRVERLRS